MNTFEKYFQQFPKLEQRILEWKPDYVVPVAKKGCKLLKASNRPNKFDPNLIKYRTFFQINNPDLSSKKVAVVDDATQFTATLQEYRNFFEKKGATVRTFSFVGHEKLFEGKRWKHDEKAEIEVFLPDPVYQEYILQQSYFLLENGNQFDLDHLILEANLPHERLDDFLSQLRMKGLLLFLEDYFLPSNTLRFSLNEPHFFDSVPFLTDKSIEIGPVRKLKFVYKKDQGRLFFSPLVFPIWTYKKTAVPETLFSNIPMDIPFKLPTKFDPRNKGALLSIYNNIQFVYMACLAKSFVQEISPTFKICESLSVKRDDLDAIFGIDNTNKLISSTKRYLCGTDSLSFATNGRKKARATVPRRGRFRDFAQVISHLQEGYERVCRRKKTRVGVHYYLPYEKLFSRFEDKASLAENLDYYCDFGVIVPETINQDGSIKRACRTGEPKSEYSWLRTQALIPLVIEQFRKEQNWKVSSAPPMVLNKLLSNFTYDYPNEHHHELHCLIGEPYTFGTLVRAYHHHRARSKPSIYYARQISPYYKWDKKDKKFFAINLPEVTKKIGYLFDERQEISYSEIVTYIRLLSKIYTLFQRVDTLNLLSICREQNYFYSHVLYNVRTWVENFSYYLDESEEGRRIQALHQCGTQCNSASEKIRLARDVTPTMKTIEDHFVGDFEFVKALEKLKNNYHEFQPAFIETLAQLESIINLQLVITNICLNAHSQDKKYVVRLNELHFEDVLSKHALSTPIEFNKHSDPDSDFTTFVNKGYEKVKLIIDSLPAEEPLLSTRLRQQDFERARNVATEYVYKERLDQAAMLFLDFTGLRSIPEPKEFVISRFYSLVEKHASDRSGVRLYGGKGGDDAFTFIFKDIAPAIECAKDIKREFSQDLFLATDGDVKLGICFTMLSPNSKEKEIILCWGLSKDCCEFKSPTFRNKGHLLVSQVTIDSMNTRGYASLITKFARLEGETLKDGSQVYFLKEIEPIQHSRQ